MEDNVLSLREKKVEGEKESDRETEIETHRNTQREIETQRERQRKERNTEVGRWNKNFPLLGMTDTKVNDGR